MTQHSRDANVDPGSAWATPLDAPMYPPYPMPFRDLELLTLQYRTDAAAIRRLLPEPLMPTGDTVLLHVARFGDVPGIGAEIHECNVMIGARLETPSGPGPRRLLALLLPRQRPRRRGRPGGPGPGQAARGGPARDTRRPGGGHGPRQRHRHPHRHAALQAASGASSPRCVAAWTWSPTSTSRSCPASTAPWSAASWWPASWPT